MKGDWSSFMGGLFGRSEEEELEKELVPFLLRISRIPKGSPARSIVLRADKGSGALGARLRRAENAYLKSSGRISLGKCVLKEFSEFSRNRRISTFARTVVLGIENNFEAGDLVRKVAKDLAESEGIEERRRSAVRVQKYSLLASAGFFVPMILGVTSSIVSLLSDLSPEGSFFGAIHAGRNEASPILDISLFCYCAILSAIASGFAGELSGGTEKKGRSFLRHASILVPLSAVVFLASRGILGAK